MAGLMLNSTVVLRLNFCEKLNICASKSATSPRRKPLCLMLKRQVTNKKLWTN